MKALLRYGAATIVAGALFASSSTARAQSTLAALVAGGTITSGDLVFSNFQNPTQTGNLNVLLTDIMVVPILTGGEYGIRFQTALWSLSGANQNYDIGFSFEVTTSSHEPITGNTLSIVGGSDGLGHANLAETVYDQGNNSLAGELVYINQSGTGNNQFVDSATFTGSPQSVILVNKDFAMTTGSDTNAQIFVSHIDQTFVVPEPSTLALSAMGGLVSLLALRRRK